MKAVLQRLARDIALLIGFGRVVDVDDSDGIQLVLLDMGEGETRKRKRYQDYGLSSVPPAGSRAVTGAIGGRRSFLTALRIDAPDFRPRNLKRGETILYTLFGDFIHLKEGRIVYVKAGTRLDVNAPDAHFFGNVVVDGTLEVLGTTTLRNSLNQTTGNISTMGNVTSVGTVSAPTLAAASMLTIAGVSYAFHGHTYTDDGSSMTTGGPVSI